MCAETSATCNSMSVCTFAPARAAGFSSQQQPVIDAEGTGSHRNTSIVYSVVISKGASGV